MSNSSYVVHHHSKEGMVSPMETSHIFCTLFATTWLAAKITSRLGKLCARSWVCANVYEKIHKKQNMYVHVIYHTDKWFLKFVWLIYLHFWILEYHLFTCFIQSLTCSRTFNFPYRKNQDSDGNNLLLELSLNYYLCFVMFHQSNQFSLDANLAARFS